MWRAFVDISHDQGVTWKKSAELTPDEAGWGVIQPTLWESQPGHVHMLLRSSRGAHAPVRAPLEERGRERERGACGLTREVETPLPSNHPRCDLMSQHQLHRTVSDNIT